MGDRRAERDHRRHEAPSSDERPDRPTALERFAPEHVFYNLVWHRRRGDSKIPFLVWLLVLQLLVVGLLVYWVL